MVFECLHGRTCECGGLGPGYRRISLGRPPILHPLGADASPPDMTLWLFAVMEYTRRCLTKPSDRLHAISGLAQFMSNDQWGKYIDSMWEQDLVKQLMWRTKSGSNYNEKTSKDYTSPSWSWASVNYPIEYNRVVCETLTQVISVKNKNSGLDLLTRSSNARLTVRGLVAEVSYAQSRSGPRSPKVSHIVQHQSPWPNTYRFHPDMSWREYSISCWRPEFPIPGSTLFLILWGVHNTGVELHTTAKLHLLKFSIVLQRAPATDNTYVRIGIYYLHLP